MIIKLLLNDLELVRRFSEVGMETLRFAQDTLHLRLNTSNVVPLMALNVQAGLSSLVFRAF